MNQTEDIIIQTAAVVAVRLYRRHRETVISDECDIQQELWIWASKKRPKIDEWLDPSQEEHDFERGKHALEKSMYRAGDRYCRTLKAKRAGYAVRDEVFYSTGLLEVLLPDAWDSIHDVSMHVHEGPKPPSNPAEGNNRAVTMFDVQRALKHLDPDLRKVLEMRFRDGMEPHEMADMLSVSKATVYRRIRSALRRMVETLGGESPWR